LLLMNFRQIVLYSTPESRRAGSISLLAVVETVFSTALFWWLGIAFDTYLHIWLTVVAAPLFLLRSPASIALGAELFVRYWQHENGHRNPIQFAPVAVCAAVVAGLVTWVLADMWLMTATGMAAFWCAAMLGVVATNFGAAIAIAVWGYRGLTEGKVAAAAVAAAATAAAVVAVALASLEIGAIAGIGAAAAVIAIALMIAGLSIEKELVGRVLRGIGITAIFVTFGFAIFTQTFGDQATNKIIGAVWLGGWALGSIAAVAGLVGTRELALIATGAGVGVFMRACAIRFIATIQQPVAGFHAFPENWLSFVLQSDIRQRPEVMPGLPDGHMLRSENRYAFWDSVSHLEEWKNKMVVGLFLELPYLLYRICLKSTAWFYLPLIYLAYNFVQPRDG
jgi:hypothetical protein